MRVAYVCADRGVPVFGRKGCSIHVQEVVRSLIASGATVDLIAARVGGAPPTELQGVCVHALPACGEADAAARERASVRANVAIRRILDALGPIDLVYERYSLWSFAAMRWARRQGVPGLLEVNAPLVEEQAQHRVLCDRSCAIGVATRAFAAARAVVAVSGEVADWVRLFPGTAGRVHVIPNGVDPSRFAASEREIDLHGGERETFTIGFVGTLKAWHGLPLLVEAFAELYGEHRRSRLLIVGDGPERAALEHQVRARGLQAAVVLTGAVAPQAIPDLLASMDVAVAPYSARRPFYFSPLKVLEYMAAGVPVVASRLGQLDALIRDGETGLLCAPDDPRALAACVRRLRASRELRLRLGAAARRVAATEHTWDMVVRHSLALVDLTLPTRNSSTADSLHATGVHA